MHLQTNECFTFASWRLQSKKRDMITLELTEETRSFTHSVAHRSSWNADSYQLVKKFSSFTKNSLLLC